MANYKFGNFLCELRIEKGLTQGELGEMLGVSDAAISKWENGEAMPRLAKLQQLADVFDVSVNELATGERNSAGNYIDELRSQGRAELNKNKDNRTKKLKLKLYIVFAISIVFIFTIVFLLNFISNKSDIAASFTKSLSFVLIEVGIFGVINGLFSYGREFTSFKKTVFDSTREFPILRSSCSYDLPLLIASAIGGVFGFLLVFQGLSNQLFNNKTSIVLLAYTIVVITISFFVKRGPQTLVFTPKGFFKEDFNGEFVNYDECEIKIKAIFYKDYSHKILIKNGRVKYKCFVPKFVDSESVLEYLSNDEKELMRKEGFKTKSSNWLGSVAIFCFVAGIWGILAADVISSFPFEEVKADKPVTVYSDLKLIEADSGYIFLLSSRENAMSIFDVNGEFIETFVFENPEGGAAEGLLFRNNIYVTFSRASRVYKFSETGGFIGLLNETDDGIAIYDYKGDVLKTVKQSEINSNKMTHSARFIAFDEDKIYTIISGNDKKIYSYNGVKKSVNETVDYFTDETQNYELTICGVCNKNGEIVVKNRVVIFLPLGIVLLIAGTIIEFKVISKNKKSIIIRQAKSHLI